MRLGATPTLCTSLVADVLAEFHGRYPGIDIEIFERGSRSLIGALVDGGLDLALIVTSVSSGAARAVLEREPLLDERLVLVSSASVQPVFASGASVPLEELARTPQIVFPENHDLRDAVDGALAAAGLEPTIALVWAEMDATLRGTERGLGVAVVSATVALDRLLLRTSRLAEPSLSRTVSIARRSDIWLTHATEALQRAVGEIADALANKGSEAARLMRSARGTEIRPLYQPSESQ